MPAYAGIFFHSILPLKHSLPKRISLFNYPVVFRDYCRCIPHKGEIFFLGSVGQPTRQQFLLVASFKVNLHANNGTPLLHSASPLWFKSP